MTIILLVLLIQKKSQQSPVQVIYSIPFLNADNHVIDSVIQSLSTTKKIDLIISTKEFYIDNIDHNMITDTVFLENYFSEKIKQKLTQHTGFYSYYLASSNFADLSDSTFFSFIAKRYQFIDKLLRRKELIVGMYFPDYLYNQISEINDTAKHSNHFQQSFLKTKVALHVFEFTQDKKFPDINFDGLLILKADSLVVINKTFIKQFLGSHLNILDLNREQKKQFQKIINKLLIENPAYINNIDTKIRKILKAQFWISNGKVKKVEKTTNPTNLFKNQLKEKTIYIAYDTDSVLPLSNSVNNNYNIIWTSDNPNKNFLKIFKYYATNYLYQPKSNKKNSYSKLKYIVKRRTNIFIIDDHINDTSLLNKLNKLLEICPKEKTVIINFGCFDNLKKLPDSLTIVQMPGNSKTDFSLAPQALFGGINISTQVPYTLNNQIKFADKINLKANKLAYTIPEMIGLNSEKLTKIDEIARQGIIKGAFPGCQVFVAKNGKVIYNKSFGYHTYSRKRRVKADDVYDLASVTKIAATTVVTMKMISDKMINLDDKLGKFFKDTHIDYNRIRPDTIIKIDTFYTKTITNMADFLKDKDTLKISDTAFVVIDTAIVKLTPTRNIFKVRLIDLLKHKSGILPAMPIFKYIYYREKYFEHLIGNYKEYQKKLSKVIQFPRFEIPDSIISKLELPDSLQQLLNGQLQELYFSYFSKKNIPDTSDIALTDSLFLKNEYFDTIWNDTKQLPVYSRKFKEYSDVNMILLQMALDSLNNKSIDKYLKKEIFNPLGLRNISYLPLKHFNNKKIVPTENDNSWRYGLLHGYVHDPSAALLGGVAGNAGLYSNAHDLGVLFQMILNGGHYGGHQYIDSMVIKQFTRKFDDTQRALGFDMPNQKAIVGNKAPNSTYGHSGYTGTCVWVDPENQLVYVFLSNRNHPSSKNWKIVNYHIRERIHDAIYDALL
ncbi:MAG: serine hydrolase [Bacteroidota bacterium]